MGIVDAATVDVYKSDRSCLAKLTAFTFGGVSYTPKAGSEFSTWAAGDTAVFQNGGLELTVRVDAQISATATNTDTIHYKFSEIVNSADDETVAQAASTDALTITVDGQEAANFVIDSIVFNGVDATGAGTFTFNMSCAGAFVAGPDTCDGLAHTTIKYLLIEDVGNDNTLTMVEAQALGWGGAISNTDLGDGTAATSSLTGPGPLLSDTNANMFLVLQADGLSYTYYDVDVSAISN